MGYKKSDIGQIPVDWEVKKIQEVGTVIAGGTPRTKIEEYWNGDISWITPKDLSNHREKYIFTGERSITKLGLDESSARLLPEGTVLYSSRAPIGYTALAGKEMATNQGFKNIICDESTLNNHFMYYLIKYKTSDIVKLAGGSTFKEVSGKIIKEFKIPVPEIPEQKAIADTLSALDNKIENNNKINENLEAQAQALFKHWFVDFEFPNENGEPYKSSGGEMVESELGMIPKGWEVDSLGKSELGNLMTSGIDSYNGEKIYLATADVVGRDIVNHQTMVTMDNKPSRANMQPEKNTVWFAKMKDSRKLILVDQNDYILQDNYIFSTGFAGIKATKLSTYYLWTYLQSDEFDEIKNLYTTGTTMQAINNKNIRRIQIPVPTEEVLEKFNYIVQSMYKKIIENRNENITLSELRDTLLPKLMSGELRIPLD